MGEKILVVDDEQEITDLVELYLQNENYTVFKYYTAGEALDCIGQTDLDLDSGHHAARRKRPFHLPKDTRQAHLSCYHANREGRGKNDLVMYLAHDIKTPLTSVIGYTSG